MKDIGDKIDNRRWFAAGIVGAIAAALPWVAAQWFIHEFGPTTESLDFWVAMVALVFGGWGGAWSYDSLIRD
jgi:drug/metabolite transporter (DMT)-like permease